MATAWESLSAAADRVTDLQIANLRDSTRDPLVLCLCADALDHQRGAHDVIAARRMIALALVERESFGVLP